MSQPEPGPQSPAQGDRQAEPLRVIAGGATKGRRADHLKGSARPPARFWDEPVPQTKSEPQSASQPTPLPQTQGQIPLPNLVDLLTAQTALIQELLVEQRRLRERLEQLEKLAGNGA